MIVIVVKDVYALVREERGELRYQVIWCVFLALFLFKTENNTYHSSYLLLVINIVNMLLLLLLINNLLDTKMFCFYSPSSLEKTETDSN